MDEMIRNLLDASRIRAGQPISLRLERCELRVVLAQTLESLALVYGDRFVLRAPAEVRGNWDGEGLRRVAENLVVNAAK